jgi:hypothetical protein
MSQALIPRLGSANQVLGISTDRCKFEKSLFEGERVVKRCIVSRIQSITSIAINGRDKQLEDRAIFDLPTRSWLFVVVATSIAHAPHHQASKVMS